jgi:phosphinothricin acetyltransferase
MSYRIRAGVITDLPALNAVYDPYVRETAVTFDLSPLSLEQRQAWFRERFVEDDDVFLVLDDGGPVGFAWSGPFRSKAAYRSSAEVSVYLAPTHRAQGHGSAMLRELLTELEARGRHRALGAVTLPNPASLALMARHGFVSVGVFSEVGEKLGRYWDVEFFERAL